MSHVLIIDEDIDTRHALADFLRRDGMTAELAENMRDAQLHIRCRRPDVVLLDGMPEALAWLTDPDACDGLEVIAITDRPCVDAVVEAMRHGALDYLIKPIDYVRLKAALARLGQVAGPGPLFCVPGPIPPCAQFGPLLGRAPVMQKLYEHIRRVAPTDASVLLLGESGTGKELAAQCVHESSLRSGQPYLPVNCGAISPQLIESEIFGHEKGSFPGADRQHKGYFERASGGTLFLDQITEMSLELQVKLLRVLENGCFMRIGSNTEVETNVRIVAATNREPEEAIAAGKLRLDLFHRLNVFPLRIPPLRERGADLELLARHFLQQFNQGQGSHKLLSRTALISVKNHDWPGNVRELRNVMYRAFILSDHVIESVVLTPTLSNPASASVALSIPVGSSLAEVDRKFIFATLELCGGVKKRAADVLGISLKTLYNRLEAYGQRTPVAGDRARVAIPNGIAM